ncbi:MAG: glycosyltransferase family 4 protein [Pseudomonadota bacterium]
MRIAVLFFNIGGYHSARLKAAQERLSDDNHQLCAIEILSSSTEHPWQFTDNDTAYQKISLFDYEAKLSTRSLVLELRAALARYGAQVVAVPGWGSTEARTALTWAKLNGAKVIAMSESKMDDAPRNLIKEWVKSVFYVRRFDAALVGGKAHSDYLQSLGMPTDKIFLGYDAVDNAYFESRVKQLSGDANCSRRAMPDIPERPYFLSVTRFIPRKNLALLIDAYANYVEKVGIADAWPLVLCGGGNEEATLRQRVNALHLEGNVKFPGFISYQNLPYWYAFAGALVHPATQEQWGLVLNEAAAAGLPIISSNTVGAAATLVENGKNGFLFPPNDRAGITHALLSVHELSPQDIARAGERSRALVAPWGPKRFADGFFDALKTVMR